MSSKRFSHVCAKLAHKRGFFPDGGAAGGLTYEKPAQQNLDLTGKAWRRCLRPDVKSLSADSRDDVMWNALTNRLIEVDVQKLNP